MKNLAKLNGAKALSKNEQKSITGGGLDCSSIYTSGRICNSHGWVCCLGNCVPFDPTCVMIDDGGKG